MKKSKKRMIIGAGIVVVGAGAYMVVSGGKTAQPQIPQVQVVQAELGDVEQLVDASGTVTSEEEKTYFSPVNARISKMDFETGDMVSKGTRLVEFNTEDLKKEKKKAKLNLKSSQYDYTDAVNKSEKAVRKQSAAKSNAASLRQQVNDQKNYVASLKSQLAQINAQAQKDARAYEEEQTRKAQEAAEAKAEEERKAQEARNQEIQRAYSEALTRYENETLPAYRSQLAELNNQANTAQNTYNQADNAYRMAFANWEANPTEETTRQLNEAEQARSQALVISQQTKEQYENLKNQQPAEPLLSDFAADGALEDFVTDGTDEFSGGENAETGSDVVQNETESAYIPPDTSELENALEQASSDLAEMQSELASEEAVAEADPASLTEEEKEKMKITSNLSEMEAKSAQELVEEGKKGITAEFNGVISKADLTEGASVTQGMELFSIQNIDKACVDINISKYDYDKVSKGQKAEITLADKTYSGTVTKISHIAAQNDKGAAVISATVRIDNPDENIFLGVDAKVKIFADTAEGVVTIPVEVVNIGKEGSFCYVIEDGVIARKDIETGISSQDYVEVISGLEAGDQVIADMGELEEGMPAEAAEESPEPSDSPAAGEGADE